MARVYVGGKFVVAAANVLDKSVADADGVVALAEGGRT
jgi:hypothetical protein